VSSLSAIPINGTTNNVTAFFSLLRELAKTKHTDLLICIRNRPSGSNDWSHPFRQQPRYSTVDAGMPQLSMHSCREVSGVADLSYGLNLRGLFAFSGYG
jgi:aspartyl aminopeptidase